MLLHKRIFYVLFLYSLSLIAQGPDKGEINYLDSDGNPTTKDKASYYEFKTVYKPGIFKYQKYFLNQSKAKAFLIEKYYFDDQGYKQGKYTSYFKDGFLNQEGIYKDNMKYGPWKTYVRMPLINMDTIENSIYLSKIEYYKNNLKDGKFKEFFEDGNLSGEGTYKSGKLFGVYTWYYKNGQICQKETYDENGKLTDLKKWDKNGKSLRVSKKDYKKEGITKQKMFETLRFYIKSSFNKNLFNQYPNKPYGTVYIQFRLDKHGRITLLRLKSTKDVPLDFKKELIRIFNDLPLQKPIYDDQHQAANYIFTLPLKV